MITRVRYFAGQVLGVAELETEQRYLIERLRRRNRRLHGWGIVGGLRRVTKPRPLVETESVLVRLFHGQCDR